MRWVAQSILFFPSAIRSANIRILAPLCTCLRILTKLSERVFFVFDRMQYMYKTTRFCMIFNFFEVFKVLKYALKGKRKTI